jgi:Zn-dependent alcohol dehydrogenase
MNPGLLLGHEGVGVVEEVAKDVRDFWTGDRVLLSAVLGCGSCDSVPGHEVPLTIHVEETNGRKASRVEWSGEFTPDGVCDEEDGQLFRGIYENGLTALAAGFASKSGQHRP